MSNGATLVTESGMMALGKRTAAIVEELATRQSSIEEPRKGRVEIVIDFKNGFLSVSVRETGESRRIE